MEYEKVTNLIGKIRDKIPRFITKKWIEVHDQSGTPENRYKPSKQIVVTNPDNDAYDRKLAFKNNAPFVSCISKINNTLTDNAEDLDIVMPMYNLIEHSKNYRKTTGSLWNHYIDEPNSGTEGNINYSIKDSKFFNFKTSITGKLEVTM